MQSFTFGSDEAMAAVEAAQEASGASYPMTMNAGDLMAVVYALREYGSFGEPDRGLSTEDYAADEERRARAESLLSGIAETLGVEFI